MFKDLMFMVRFDSANHIREYVTLLDHLLQQGKARVYASEQEFQSSAGSGTIPTIDTSNGIRMMYSIRNSLDSTRHHLSISRSPYLATRYAKHLTALFCHLSGLSVPGIVYRGARLIYHVQYVLSQTEQEQFEAYPHPERSDPKTIFLRAFMASVPIRIELLPDLTRTEGRSI